MFDLNELDYSKIKLFLLVALLQLLSLGAGFYSGYIYSFERNQPLLNYTTNPISKPQDKAIKASPATDRSNECLIKGSKSKIYHLPEGAFYDRTNAMECFATEQEAINAGYTKSTK